MSRVFPIQSRPYTAAQAESWARDFGVGLGGSLAQADQRYLSPTESLALPMIAVPLGDGEFWQSHPDTGIDWRKMIHAQESMTQHRPLPNAGTVLIRKEVVDIRDRGAEKGAALSTRAHILDTEGEPYVTIDVVTILLGNGGFGGPAPTPGPREALPERAPDDVLELCTPSAAGTGLCISGELSVGMNVPGRQAHQKMIRGVGCFGLLGRAVLAMAAGNDPVRLKTLSIRYAGPMLTDETMRVELWRLTPERVTFRMHAVERNAPVVGIGTATIHLA